LTREIPASSKTALECVMEVDEERILLEKQAEELATMEDDESQEQLMDVYERLDEMAADQAEARASRLLFGLGFDKGEFITISLRSFYRNIVFSKINVL
jgi:ATP-binding cassette, subfamily F, member 2